MQKAKKVKFETRALNGNEIAWGMTFDCLNNNKKKKERTVSTRDKIKKEEEKKTNYSCVLRTRRERERKKKKVTKKKARTLTVYCTRFLVIAMEKGGKVHIKKPSSLSSVLRSPVPR